MQTELLKQPHELQNRVIESENQNQFLLKKHSILEEKIKNLNANQALFQDSYSYPELLAQANPITHNNDIIFQQIFQKSLDAMLLLSPQGVILAANRTPLNGILGMAGLLTKTPSNKAQQKYLNIIDYSASNLLVIINDILDLAKIESGKLILEQIPFNIQEVLQSTQQALEYKAEEKDILLIVKGFNLINPYVVGDPHRLTQILLNLVSNAIKFTSQGVVVICTDIIEETATHLKFLITVKDTGIGIPKEKQEIIFDNFTQADSHTSRNFGGVGLGLTICKNLVEKQDGCIWVESIPGKGSEFKFELAFRKAAPAQIEEVISDNEPVDFTSLGNLHILLAEDNEVNQFLAQSIMQNWGFTNDVAKNGKEAVALAASRNYDLILMDIQMPEVSGTEATQLIRQLPELQKARTPIIALTANALKGDAEQFIAAGMNDYLAKPFEECKLFQKIAANLTDSLSTNSPDKTKRNNNCDTFL